jgi:type IV pilus assembly protein PilA
MFCTNCGKEIPEGAQTCPHCNQPVAASAPAGLAPGAGTGQPAAPTPPIPQVTPGARFSGMAIASMILGILGVITFGWLGILGLVGLILGIVAVRKINRAPEPIRGKGMAIAGIATGAVSTFLLLGVVAAIAIPNFLKYTARAKQSEAKINLTAIWMAQEEYHYDTNQYGETFQEIVWAPEGQTRYSYHLLPGEVIDASVGGPYSLPPDVEAFVDDFTFQAVAVGNIDPDDTLDVWTIDQDKTLKNVVNDVEE